MSTPSSRVIKNVSDSVILNLLPQAPSSTFRTPLERVDTPIRCTESNRTIRFALSLLVSPVEAKTFPVLPFSNPHPLTPSSTVRTSLEQGNRPFRRAESNDGVRLAVRPLVLE